MIDAKLACVLSFFIPGLGQGLQGQIRKGLILFIIAVILHFIIAFLFNNLLGSILQIAYSIYAAYDAYQISLD